jgi:uncharacterized Fe-S cluster protein YjdI
MSNSEKSFLREHRYTNGEVTVIWKPQLCMHSSNCWRQLRSVFDPGKKPWINIEGGSTVQIVEQVKRCPSGALSFQMNNEQNASGK